MADGVWSWDDDGGREKRMNQDRVRWRPVFYKYTYSMYICTFAYNKHEIIIKYITLCGVLNEHLSWLICKTGSTCFVTWHLAAFWDRRAMTKGAKWDGSICVRETEGGSEGDIEGGAEKDRERERRGLGWVQREEPGWLALRGWRNAAKIATATDAEADARRHVERRAGEVRGYKYHPMTQLDRLRSSVIAHPPFKVSSGHRPTTLRPFNSA